MTSEAIDRSIATLTAWLQKNAPKLANSFGAPADAEAIADVEEMLGAKLPDDYRAFLAKHDGQRFVPVDDESGTLSPLFAGFDILPLQFAAGEYETIENDWDDEGPGDVVTHGPVRPFHRHPKWWPITCVFGASQYHCIDLDPAPGGNVGQVIFIADDDSHRRVVAKSFAAFLEMLVAAVGKPGVEASEEGIDLPDEAFEPLLGAE